MNLTLHYRGRMSKNGCISCAARATWAVLQVPLGISMIMSISDMMHNVSMRKCRCSNRNVCGEGKRDRFIKWCVWSQLERQLYKRRQAQSLLLEFYNSCINYWQQQCISEMTVVFNRYSHILSPLIKIFPSTSENILLCFPQGRGCKEVFQLLVFAKWMKASASLSCSGWTQLSAAGQASTLPFCFPESLTDRQPCLHFTKSFTWGRLYICKCRSISQGQQSQGHIFECSRKTGSPAIGC